MGTDAQAGPKTRLPPEGKASGRKSADHDTPTPVADRSLRKACAVPAAGESMPAFVRRATDSEISPDAP